ncbi:hypothetical protein GWI33_000478, partial [Rhynchophorus ferrugineus]
VPLYICPPPPPMDEANYSPTEETRLLPGLSSLGATTRASVRVAFEDNWITLRHSPEVDEVPFGRPVDMEALQASGIAQDLKT